jgi:phosphoserine aminotransferase
MNLPVLLVDASRSLALLRSGTIRAARPPKAVVYNCWRRLARGGMRASIYDAMPIEGVERLVEYMREFEAKRG